MVTTGHHGLHHPILYKSFCCFLHHPRRTGMTDHSKHDSVEGLRSITLKLLLILVPRLLSDHYDEPAGRTVVAMTVHHDLRNPTLRSHFPIFLQQLHYGATYGPSQARQTITNPVAGSFSAFLGQKLSCSSLNRFSAKNEKIT